MYYCSKGVFHDFNLMLLPGVTSEDHTAVITKALEIAEQRGDFFVIIDPTNYGSTLSATTTEAATRDSSYGAVYWPWVQVRDSRLGINRWVPPSVVMSGIYSFNDKVAHPWFAPAGLNISHQRRPGRSWQSRIRLRPSSAAT